MSVDPLAAVDARRLGERLQQARKARRKTQQDAADFLGVARTTIVALEKGVRRVQPLELVKLAGLYGRQVSELLRTAEPTAPFAVQLRAALAPNESIADELDPRTWEFQQLCEDYVEIERLMDAPLPRHYPPERDVSGTSVERAAEDLATNERTRLGLGDGPVPNLRALLEHEVGLRTFYLDLPSNVSGLFAFDESLGGCIAVNRRHPEERRRNSLVHEYLHFLTTRYQSEVTVHDRYRRRPEHERLANAFAPAFLMPAAGISRRFNEAKRRRGDFTIADLCTLAAYYVVSVESLTRRLEELRLVSVGTWDKVRDSGLRVQEARALLSLTAPTAQDDLLPSRYLFLCVGAYQDNRISEGQFARFLRVDRLEARRVAATVASSAEGTESVRIDRTMPGASADSASPPEQVSEAQLDWLE
jgi:Zn-dependent peptidase ImmA (M78 family)/transcriptional regulator with XRE-family HTH domain